MRNANAPTEMHDMKIQTAHNGTAKSWSKAYPKMNASSAERRTYPRHCQMLGPPFREFQNLK